MTATLAKNKKGSCTKREWKTKAEAWAAIDELKEENHGLIGIGTRPYRCTRCKKWHIGRNRRRTPSLGRGGRRS